MSVDIHGTDPSELPRVLGVRIPESDSDRREAVVLLNFVPSASQLVSMCEHLASWTPPDGDQP